MQIDDLRLKVQPQLLTFSLRRLYPTVTSSYHINTRLAAMTFVHELYSIFMVLCREWRELTINSRALGTHTQWCRANSMNVYVERSVTILEYSIVSIGKTVFNDEQQNTRELLERAIRDEDTLQCVDNVRSGDKLCMIQLYGAFWNDHLEINRGRVQHILYRAWN